MTYAIDNNTNKNKIRIKVTKRTLIVTQLINENKHEFSIFIENNLNIECLQSDQFLMTKNGWHFEAQLMRTKNPVLVKRISCQLVCVYFFFLFARK